MASTSAFTLEQDPQDHIIAPDDSDFLDSEAESASTPHPDDDLIESAVLADLPTTPHRASSSPSKRKENRLWPAHPLIRIHKRLWFTYFPGTLPDEEILNQHNGQGAAWKNFDDAEVKKHIDPSETNPQRLHWFNIDHDLVYLSFWFDWGPLNVGMFYRFCLHVHHMLTDVDMQDATLVLYTTDAPAQKANAALLVTLYAMIIGKVSPADAFFPISEVEFKPFRDAGYGRADYCLTIQDILYGVHRGIAEGLLDLTSFNLDEYEKYEQVSNGDWNWITPNFIAFASPNDRNYVEALRVGDGRLPSSYSFRPPSEDKLFGRTIRYFKDRGVKLVVRLNNPLYDREAFLNAGIEHSDMYFDDGSNPTEEILREFIEKADKVIKEDGVVAVHCKAGLGRTGVLIGAYLVWKHGFSAGEVIGFMRFMRPGCVVGPQQHFMYQNFVEWVKWGVKDQAMEEARLVMEKEREELKPKMGAEVRASVKRRKVGSDAAKDEEEAEVEDETRSEEEDGEEEEERPRQKVKSDFDYGEGPVTPKAQRGGSRAVPQSAAPNIKPAPCVGQPRKSPSPSRKRPAIQAPATVARLELTSRRYPAATRSFDTHLMLSSHTHSAVHEDSAPAPAADDVDGEDKPLASSSPRGNGSAGVLVESRINISPISTTPRASPKAAVVQLTPSPVARVRGFERVRSNTIATPPVRVSSRVEESPRPEVFRASPSVRERFGLRDSSHSPPAPSPVVARSRQNSPVKVVSDADVLGVIDVIPQHRSPVRHVTPSPAKVVKKEEPATAVADENTQVHRAPVTAGAGPKVLRSVKSKPTIDSSARPATTVRKPPVPTRAAATTSRSVSAKIPPSTSTVRPSIRPQKSVADLRAKTPTTTNPSAGVRNVSNSSTTATVSRPASRLTAPTAASAARAAAAAEKRAGTAGVVSKGTLGVGARKVSTVLQKQVGTGARRRRSSTGEAGLDVVA